MSSFGMDACTEIFATPIKFMMVGELKQRLTEVWRDFR